MSALNYESVEITTGPRSLRDIDRPNATNWRLLEHADVQLAELLACSTDSRFKLVDAQYLDCDPSISGAFRTKFLSTEHFGERDQHPDADWVRPTLRDYADFPWEVVWWTIEPLFRNDDAGPRVLRIHLVNSRLDRPVDLFASTPIEGHPDVQDCCHF